jgi:hypothetical protein
MASEIWLRYFFKDHKPTAKFNRRYAAEKRESD